MCYKITVRFVRGPTIRCMWNGVPWNPHCFGGTTCYSAESLRGRAGNCVASPLLPRRYPTVSAESETLRAPALRRGAPSSAPVVKPGGQAGSAVVEAFVTEAAQWCNKNVIGQAALTYDVYSPVLVCVSVLFFWSLCARDARSAGVWYASMKQSASC